MTIFLRILVACALAATAAAEIYQWDLPRGFPKPRVPASNPMSASKALLGRYLFYDTRLSVNRRQSCASCHRQELAFTDGRAHAVGTTGEAHSRGAMSLVNVAYNAVLTWMDPNQRLLEKQVLVPMLGEHPVELGLRGSQATVLAALRREPVYQRLFPKAFPSDPNPFTFDSIAKALAAFQRTILSARSPYDRFYSGGDPAAISDSAKRGEALFFTDPIAGCFRCHGGFNFSDTTIYEGGASPPIPFHNTGLYNVAGRFSYPAPNLGVYLHTKRARDLGKFKAPTLRNIALTAPYMHDGSIATLEEAIDHYAAGGRTIAEGPYAGIGSRNPAKDPRVAPIALTRQNRQDLLAFLQSLTDAEVIADPRFSNPW